MKIWVQKQPGPNHEQFVTGERALKYVYTCSGGVT
jgi:hypothetical protein